LEDSDEVNFGSKDDNDFQKSQQFKGGYFKGLMKDDEERESPLQKVSYTFGEVNEEEDEDGIPAAKNIF
jgi:hypothetical protein